MATRRIRILDFAEGETHPAEGRKICSIRVLCVANCIALEAPLIHHYPRNLSLLPHQDFHKISPS